MESSAEHIHMARAEDAPEILATINAEAQRYRGAIPDDCWREPYMSLEELAEQFAQGVVFSVVKAGGLVVGVMGIQRVDDADLRHAYVKPSHQGEGVGGRELRHRVL